MAGPTLSSKFYVPSGSSGGNSNTLTTSSFTPSAGDVLIVKGGTWDTSATLNTPTGGSQTYTNRVTVSPGSSRSWCAIWSCTISGSPGSMTVSITPSTSCMHSLEVEWWTGAQLATTPVTSSANSINGTPSGSITTTAANSVISMVNVDWQSQNPSTVAYVNSANVTQEDILDAHASADSVHYFWRQTVATAGSTSYGLTSPTAQNYSMAAIEVLAAAAAAQAPARPVVVLRQAAPRAAIF